LRQNLDESFVRRLAFTVHFPFPDEANRRRIWTGIWPKEAPLDQDADFDFLAKQFKLSGGNIKNVALAAAFLAAQEDRPIAMRHLVVAVEREYQKMSKPLGPEHFGPYAVEVRP
jgi:ATP-dependent 26S proteasome regulatory subunit